MTTAQIATKPLTLAQMTRAAMKGAPKDRSGTPVEVELLDGRVAGVQSQHGGRGQKPAPYWYARSEGAFTWLGKAEAKALVDGREVTAF